MGGRVEERAGPATLKRSYSPLIRIQPTAIGAT